MKRELELDGRSFPVTVLRGPGGTDVLLGAERRRVRLESLGDGEHSLEIDGRAETVWIARKGDDTWIHAHGRHWRVRSVDPLQAEAAGAAADTAEAPMPGTVVRVLVAPGDRVERGQPLVVIESMKMETSIVAWRDGVVERVHHAVGATFDRKAPLVSLEK